MSAVAVELVDVGALTGRRPTNSGMRPYFRRSSGRTWRVQLRDVLVAARVRTSAPKPTPLRPIALLDDLLQAREGPAADEQHVGGVDLDELLVGVLAAALRRHRGDRALEDLQQRLLHALAGDVPRDRRVLALAGDLVDLVDVDDPGLGLLDVEVGGLDQLEQDVLDVLADVAGLGERGGVRDREGHVEQPRQRLRQQRLARSRWGPAAGCWTWRARRRRRAWPCRYADALVVVVDRDREGLLGVVLADDVVVQELVDLDAAWGGHRRTSSGVSANSSSMISLQRSMHSSQM